MNTKINNALKLLALCVIVFASCKSDSFVSRKYMKGRFVERIGDLAHKKSSNSESNKALKAQPLIEEQIINRNSIRRENNTAEQTFVNKRKNKESSIKKFETGKDSTSQKDKNNVPPAKRKYKRVMKGFCWVWGASIVPVSIVLILDFIKGIYLKFIWLLIDVLFPISLIASCSLFVLLFIYVFLKQTKKFMSENEEKKGYTKVKWEYIFLLLVQLVCLFIAAFGSFAIIPSVFMALISVLYYHKERKLTKETDFFNYKRTRMFMVFVGIILMLSFVLAFGGIF